MGQGFISIAVPQEVLESVNGMRIQYSVFSQT